MSFTVFIDGEPHKATPGETVLDVADRANAEIPTLCHDPRLEPAGACRACLVEVEGEGRLQPGCTWKVAPEMKITTRSDRIARHQRILFSMYAADHARDDSGLPAESPNVNQLRGLTERIDLLPLRSLAAPRRGRPTDPNPYLTFDPDRCIVCARCTRYCDEVEAVNAITLAFRGAETTISTAADRGLLDTTCELCGGCIDTCPTGALVEKKPPADLRVHDVEKVRTTCNYCGVGCQMDLNVSEGRVVKVTSPPPGETVNDGNLCVKGRFAYDFIHHDDRITQPMVRGDDGELHPTSWEHAIDAAAKGLLGVKERHGADALGFISSSRCTGEENYLVQKLARAAFGTNNCHQCAAT
ncbi:MAG: 2Fe-2S iron-sulfur cluster-binding protein [Thermoanaerobaculia bacterium]